MKTSIATLAAVAAFSALPMTAQAGGLEIGWLDCVIQKDGRWLAIRTNQEVRCNYTPQPNRGTSENYVGTIEKFGLDIGGTGHKIMQWKVIAVGSNAYQPGSLSGTYLGVSGEATVAIGAGASVLGGGSNDSFLLQPVSIQEQAGLNVAAGITRFTLQSK
ncbi:MAG TPA: DUF992 domain-containing protein [Mesorhizobium sp.]|jgi:hypothetical protein